MAWNRKFFCAASLMYESMSREYISVMFQEGGNRSVAERIVKGKNTCFEIRRCWHPMQRGRSDDVTPT